MTGNFVAGDTNSKLRVRCKKLDGSIIDLAGSTITLRFRIENGTLVSRTMTAETPSTDGFAGYVFLAGELSAQGMLKGEVEILNSSKVLSNSKVFLIPIRGKV